MAGAYSTEHNEYGGRVHGDDEGVSFVGNFDLWNSKYQFSFSIRKENSEKDVSETVSKLRCILLMYLVFLFVDLRNR